MVGYKVAVGIDRKNGPFPVLVKLEVPEDATIVRLFDGIRLDYFSFSGRTLPKLRTNKAKVIEMKPMSTWENYMEDWNRKAYSIYILSRNFNMGISNPDFCYEEEKEVSSYLTLDERFSCAAGIHFFESIEDANKYLLFDNYLMRWIIKFSKIWTSQNNPVSDEDYQQYINFYKNHFIDLSK